MKVLFYFGLAMAAASIFYISIYYQKLDIESRGRLVQMKIDSISASALTPFIPCQLNLSYNGKHYAKNMWANSCNKLPKGQSIKLKMLDGSACVMFPGESALLYLIVFATLGQLGIILALYQWKSMRFKKESNRVFRPAAIVK